VAAISRILVPVDFSASSRAALDYAAQLAEQTHARVEVLHVREASAYGGPESVILVPRGGAAGPTWEETRAAIEREVESFVGPLRGRVAVHVKSGVAGDIISDTARSGGFDLVVMGTNGRSGLSRLLVGSVAETVMRKAPVPVLTVRMPRREPRERIPL
jgi:nucleotide-binding universal stress UspA family protein